MTEYPTEQDCQLMLDVSNAFDTLPANGLSEPYRVFLRKVKNEESEESVNNWLKLWNDCFGPKSPWAYKINSKGKKQVYWHSQKAQELGILQQ